MFAELLAMILLLNMGYFALISCYEIAQLIRERAGHEAAPRVASAAKKRGA